MQSEELQVCGEDFEGSASAWLAGEKYRIELGISDQVFGIIRMCKFMCLFLI